MARLRKLIARLSWLHFERLGMAFFASKFNLQVRLSTQHKPVRKFNLRVLAVPFNRLKVSGLLPISGETLVTLCWNASEAENETIATFAQI